MLKHRALADARAGNQTGDAGQSGEMFGQAR